MESLHVFLAFAVLLSLSLLISSSTTKNQGIAFADTQNAAAGNTLNTTTSIAPTNQTTTNQTTGSNSPVSWNATIYESGLPNGIEWSISHNGMQESEHSPNAIVIHGISSNYNFTVFNSTLNATTYTPTITNWVIAPNQVVTVNFTAAQKQNTTTTITTTTTTTINQSSSGSSKTFLNYNGNGMSSGHVHAHGNHASFYLNKSVFASASAILTSLNTSFIITVTNQSAAVGNVPAFTNSPVYQYIQINATNLATGQNLDYYVKNVTYNFSVPQQWVNSYGINYTQIRLFKYTENGWEALPTTPTTSNQEFYSYSATSNSFSTYVVGYVSGAVFLTTSNALLTLTTGLYNYMFAGAGQLHGTTSPTVTLNFTSTASNTNEKFTSTFHLNASEIGNTLQGSATGNWIFTTGETLYNTILIGIGANVIFANGNVVTNAISTNTFALAYNVPVSNSVVYLFFAAAGNALAEPTLPAGCTADNYDVEQNASVESANCIEGPSSGNFVVTTTLGNTLKKDVAQAAAAYIFPPYSVAFNDIPASGNIISNAVTLVNGGSQTAIGTSTINAIPPQTESSAVGNYVFKNWTTNSPIAGTTSNFIVVSTTSANTYLSIMGNGIVTANWNAVWASINAPAGYAGINTVQTIWASMANSVGTLSYNFLIYNSIGLVTNALFNGVSSSYNGFSFTQNSAWGEGTFTANIIITDSSSYPAVTLYNSLTYTATPALTLGNSVYGDNMIDVVISSASDNALVTASCFSGDTCQVWYNGASHSSGTATATLAYNSLSSGFTYVYANDITKSLVSANALINRIPISYNITVNLKNSQSVNAVPNMPLSFTFNADNFTTIEANTLNNTMVYFNNGTAAYSWLEGSVANEVAATNTLVTSTNVVYWARLPPSNTFLGPKSTATVQVGFSGTKNNIIDGNFIGIAPQLSCTTPSKTPGTGCSSGQYGKYDDGANVFSLYDNFKGTTLSMQWKQIVSGSTSVQNGLTISVADGGVSNTFSVPSAWNGVYGEAYMNATTPTSAFWLFFGNDVTLSSSTLPENGYFGALAASSNTKENTQIIYEATQTVLGQIADVLTSGHRYKELFSWNNSNTFIVYNFGDSSNAPVATNVQIPISLVTNAAILIVSGTYFVQWYAAGAPPPNGIAPSITYTSEWPYITLANSVYGGNMIDIVANSASDNALLTATCITGDTCQIWYNGASQASGTSSVSIAYNTLPLGLTWLYAKDTGIHRVSANSVINRVTSSFNSILTFTNNQAVNAPGNDPISFTLNALNFSDDESKTLNNTFVYFNNGSVALSLIEGNVSNEIQPMNTLINSNDVLYWVRFPPSNTFLGNYGNSVTLQLGFSAVGTDDFDGNFIGIAPQLTCANPANTAKCAAGGPATGIYADVDTSPAIFTFADNFTGGSLSPLWSTITNGVVTVDNSLKLQNTTSIAGAIVSANAFSGYPYILEGLYNSSTVNSYTAIEETPHNGLGSCTGSGCSSPFTSPALAYPQGYLAGTSGATPYTISGFAAVSDHISGTITESGYPESISTLTSTGGKSGILGVEWSATGAQNFTYNYTTMTSTTNTLNPISSMYFAAVAFAQVTQPATGYLQWIRARIPPPNDVMPSVTFTPNSLVCGISLSNTAISFGQINPGTNTPYTSNTVSDTNYQGTLNSNIMVDGTSWVLGINSFYVTNTVWNPNNAPFLAANTALGAPVYNGQLQLDPGNLVNTGIYMAVAGSNNIYFGLGIPPGETTGSYSENIVIENKC